MKLKRIFLIFASCGAPFLSGCSSLGEQMAWDVKPFNTASSDNPAALYQIGRYYQGQHRLEKAADAYRRALAADPGFVEARNALGVVYSLQGRYGEAIGEFEAAAKLSPGSAYIRNNLGYVYYLQGKYADSVSALKQAASLAPGDEKARNNLELASRRLGKTAASSETPVSRESSGVVVYPSAAQSAKLPEDRVDAKKPDRYRIEISNGNGVNGFARRVGAELVSQGYPVGRYTNQKPFDVKVSHLEYRAGYGEKAGLVARMLPVKARMIEAADLRRDISVRLVLGRDFEGRNIAANGHAKPGVKQKS